MSVVEGFPGGASGKEPACQWRRCNKCRIHPWVGKIPRRRACQSTPVFLPGWRSLVGYSPWGHKESERHSNQTITTTTIWLETSQVELQALWNSASLISGSQPHLGWCLALISQVCGLHWFHPWLLFMEALLFVRLSSAFYRLHSEAPFCIWKTSWHPFCRIRKLKSKLHRATKRQNVHLDSFMYIFILRYVRGETTLWI